MSKKVYDIIVIGGGAAGMMASGRAAECGASVLLLEKNDGLGKKLLITGGGRCNVTNAESDQHLFLAKYQDAAKFLFSPLARFSVQDTLEFFHALGMKTKVEAEKRVFPVSDNAQSVWDALDRYMKRGKVTVMSDSEVLGLEHSETEITGVRLKNGIVYQAERYILATGGKSHPETGSTGDGFIWLKAIGHTVKNARAALVPLRVRESWVHQLSGLSFTNAKFTYFHKDKKQESKKGKILFTHFGLSGPLVLNMSKGVSEFLEYGQVKVSIDIFPSVDSGELDRQIQTLFEEQKNRQVKNSLDGFLPNLLISPLLELCNIDQDKPVHSITRDERLRIGERLKNLDMTVTALMGMEKAVVTSGGVALEEVDFRTMQSRLYTNLHVVGDLLNIDRPSGGYSLQLCWTTGFVAGTSAAEKK
jgi:predicted Rossmann fold flavoprotein